jgi:hypothetical protein
MHEAQEIERLLNLLFSKKKNEFIIFAKRFGLNSEQIKFLLKGS